MPLNSISRSSSVDDGRELADEVLLWGAAGEPGDGNLAAAGKKDGGNRNQQNIWMHGIPPCGYIPCSYYTSDAKEINEEFLKF